MAERPAVTKKAASLKGEERTKFLHDYNEAAHQKVLGVMKAENARLIPMKVEILNKVIRTDHDDDVQFVLYGSKDHEVLGTNKSATRAGMGAYQLGATRPWKDFVAPTKMEYKDVNKDGSMDVVFTFKIQGSGFGHGSGRHHGHVTLHAGQRPSRNRLRRRSGSDRQGCQGCFPRRQDPALI